MGLHTFDPAKVGKLDDPASRFRGVSAEELVWAAGADPDDTLTDFGELSGATSTTTFDEFASETAFELGPTNCAASEAATTD